MYNFMFAQYNIWHIVVTMLGDDSYVYKLRFLLHEGIILTTSQEAVSGSK